MHGPATKDKTINYQANMGRLTQPLKWHGGKHYLAPRIVALMPPHLHFVEPFFGGGSVLLEKDPHGVSEVVNDRSYELTNFWRVLQSEETFARFQRRIEATPFSQQEWLDAGEFLRRDQVRWLGDGWQTSSGADVDRAVAFFVRCRQSRAGKTSEFAPLSKNRTRRNMNEQASAWLTAVAGLAEVAQRMKRVVILNDDAINVILREDTPNTLFYLDPPYLHETRVTVKDYTYEMTEDDHFVLLKTIQELQGKVMLSGYPSKMYDRELADWRYVDFHIDNKASAAKRKPKKIERLWMNF